MKKLLVVASLISSAMLTGCDNENSVNPQPLGTAKISGTVYADFDYTNNTEGTTYDKVANRKMIAYVYDDYSESGNFRVIETSTDANGNYSIEIPVGNRELEVDIKLVDFKQTVKYADTTEEEVFYGDWFYESEDVVKGDEYIRDIYYGD
jgi:major membrane immunogen (membrane-anchored lipoprotein)